MHTLKNNMKGNNLKEGIVADDSYDDLGCAERSKEWFLFLPFYLRIKMNDTYKNWNRIKREKWLVERDLVYSIGTWRSLLSKQQCCLSVSIHLFMLHWESIWDFLKVVCNPSLLGIIFIFLCAVLVTWCWFPGLRWVFHSKCQFLCISALPKWCEVVLKSSGSAWRRWSLPHFAKYLVLVLLLTGDCALLHVMIS